MHEQLKKFLDSQNIEFKYNIPIASKSYFKTGSLVNFLIYPNSKNQLQIILKKINSYSLTYFVIGATSNILFLDNKKFEIIISTIKLNKISIDKTNKIIEVESGVMMTRLAQESLKFNFGGFEGISGIPGTVGGGITMNAGAFGNEISDLLINVQLLDNNGEFKNISKDKLEFSFRNSLFRKKNLGIIVSAQFRGLEKIPEMIKMIIARNRINRSTFQESTYPNLGSLFATRDIYSELAKFDSKYKKKLYIIRKIYSRTNTMPTNNIIINYITCKHFNIDYKNRVFSDKTMNCLVNKNTTTDKCLEYIAKIQKITQNTLPLENIII